MLVRKTWRLSLIFLVLTGTLVARSADLVWQQRDGYRVAKLSVPGNGRTGFTLLTTAQTGIAFTNQLSYNRSLTNQNTLNGAGVAAGDFDGDGWPDLYFCNLEGPNALFRNLGDGRFQNVTTAAHAACTNLISRGAVFADVNADGALDLLVTSLLGPNALLLNDGHGGFTDATTNAGLALKAGSESLALADIDGDGDLDLYIANNGDNSLLRSGGEISTRRVGNRDVVSGRNAQRLRIVRGQIIELGPPDVLYLNDGHGRFTAASWTDGTFLAADGQPLRDAPRDLGLSVMFRDLNGDGAPDLYVCNDFQTPDRVWINDGRGRFRALPDLALRQTCLFSMGVDFADIDRDGHDDFFVSDMLSRSATLRLRQINTTNPPADHVGEPMDRVQSHRNTLCWNRGDGTWAEIAHYAGVDASDWTWSVVFLDVDLDGYEDLLIANGHAYDTQDLDVSEAPGAPAVGPPTAAGSMRGGKDLKAFPPLRTPNFLFHNRGDLTFDETGARWGFDSTQISHGIALVDLDQDGDQDVVVSCLWDPPLIYRNDSSAPRVSVRLRGLPGNRQGIGARIVVRGGAVPVQSQEMICGGRYLSADDPLRVFAAGTLTNQLSIEVTWRSGARSQIAKAEPNCIYEVEESKAGPAPVVSPRATGTPLFRDVSDRLAHQHHDPPFNELERQPLLARELSRLGPGVGWVDLNGDGHEDLVIGAGHGDPLGVFTGNGQGGFARQGSAPWNVLMKDDTAGIASWISAPGQGGLLVALSAYESAEAAAGTVLRFEGTSPTPQPLLRGPPLDSPGPLAVADIDGDGDLDVFAGGRVVPGRYPEAASSQLWRNEGGALQPDTASAPALSKIGLVSGAVFSDLDADGLPELILACEWGPIRILRFVQGKPVAWDPPVTLHGQRTSLSQLTGWWNSITAGDLDGDGRLDLIAGNWGLNSSFRQPTPSEPLRLYYGDFDTNGAVDLVEAWTDRDTGRIVPRRDLAFLGTGLPLLRTRIANHRAFSGMDVTAVLGDQAMHAGKVQAVTLASMAFLHRGDHFEAVPLPREAQFAPVFGLSVADFDGDGHEDVFLAQNCFALRLEEPRLDAGRGLLLRGDGRGGLVAVSGTESGVMIYGEQRGCAAGDFDEDGRTDLVVAQNNAATKLLRNEGARPGLRVRLHGPPSNPSALGAVVSLIMADKAGPVREIHGGSGFGSQDSVVPVLALPQTPTGVRVRWPGGRVTTAPIPPGAREVKVSAP